MPVTNAEAQKVIAAAHARAAEIGIRASVAIVDEGGLLQWLGRMDGSPPLAGQIAESKASGCALTLREGASMAEVHKERPAFFAVLDKLARMPLVPGLGSLLIKRGDAVVGAIGVSGGKPDQDLDCATAALKSI
jgi:glc operon protein GlcG